MQEIKKITNSIEFKMLKNLDVFRKIYLNGFYYQKTYNTRCVYEIHCYGLIEKLTYALDHNDYTV